MKLTKYISLLLAIILLQTCDDYLNIENKGKVDAGSIAGNVNNLELLLTSVYATAASNRFQKCMYVFGEATADNMYLIETSPTSEDMQLCTYRYTPTNYLLLDMWKSCYEGINRANRTLENIEIVFPEWYGFVTSDDRKDLGLYEDNASRLQFMAGEAKFWRAFFYFYLVRTFGDVPIQNEEQYINREGNNFFTPRVPVLEVYDYIEKDLREAIVQCRKLNVFSNADDMKNAGRMHRGAATALLIKVLGYKASVDNANALTHWQEVLDLSNWLSGETSVSYTAPEMLKFSEMYPDLTWPDVVRKLYINTTNDQFKSPEATLNAPNDYKLLQYYDLLFRVESEFCAENIIEINHGYSGTGLENDNNVGSSAWDQISNLEINSNQTGSSKFMKPSLLLANVKQNLTPADPRLLFCLPPNQAKITETLEFGNEPATTPGNSHSGKYFVWPEFWPSNGVENDNPRNVVWFRYAEVLLWQAEALNELGYATEAISRVNLLRERASISKGIIGEMTSDLFTSTVTNYQSGMPFPNRLLYLQQYTNADKLPSIPVQDKETNRRAIWYERDIELCHEWDRFYDLVRTEQIVQALKDYNQAETKTDLRYKLFIKGKHEIFAIPHDEILKSNGKWKQNPGF